MLGYATGEPIFHIGDNPIIRMSSAEVQAALDAAGIAVAEGGTAMATYLAQVDAGAIAVNPDLVIAKQNRPSLQPIATHFSIGG